LRRALRRAPTLALSLALAFLAVAPALAQKAGVPATIEDLKKTAPKVFIDCNDCDLDYIRTEITFVNYVRDRKEAQVHVLITTLKTGSGGREYTLSFLGQNEFAGINDTQAYYSNKTDTEDEIRYGLVNALKMGLMSYVARTPIASRVAISYAAETRPTAKADKWRSWVFSLSGNAHLHGEHSLSTRALDAAFSASRITSAAKISLSLTGSDELDHFTFEDERIESRSRSVDLEGLFVKSLGEHWSVGAFVSARSSSFENLKAGLQVSPAIEFDLFPYSQSTRRQLRFLYKIGVKAARYEEETIYDKLRETRLSESLSSTFEVKEKWGSINTSLEASHYFHDLDKYRLQLLTIVQVKLFKGFSFYAVASGSRIHDQLSLAKAGASLDEVLLRRRQQATNYSYFVSVGVGYTFGSIFTNVVNPRFGSEEASGVQITVEE
jgi:hypothetical protein